MECAKSRTRVRCRMRGSSLRQAGDFLLAEILSFLGFYFDYVYLFRYHILHCIYIFCTYSS
ncbi:uncharacterized protein DS421_20g697810 [Arachis hypogaea]|nr:uncharacterized protein DS421_20g697810 [Arachis hypogaea]